MSGYIEGRAAWLQLEQMKAMKPSDDGTCRKCLGAANGVPLCDVCDDTRLDLMRRFGGRAGSNNARRKFTAEREEWMPFKESVDRR